MKREIGGLEFNLLGDLRLLKDATGNIVERTHRLPPGVTPNRYAAGPFCSFELTEASAASGVYALVVDDEIKYIGEAEDLARRFGPAGYGQIASRNLHRDGQSTNCKINSRVLEVYKAGRFVSVWFLPAGSERKTIESRLLAELSPPWNGSVPSSIPHPTHSLGQVAAVSSAKEDRFDLALRAAFADGSRAGKTSVRVRSGDLHRDVGGYPGPSHQMPQCCRAMKAAMGPGDRIIESPPKGAGANLVIEYRLPR